MGENLTPSDNERLVDLGLKRLLNAALGPDLVGGQRPSEESIRAYLSGCATEAQQQEVGEAMALSQAFADEMLHELQARADLQDPELASRLGKIEVPLDDLMKRAGLKSAVTARTRPGASERFLDGLRNWLWRPALGYGLAAAILLGAIMVPRWESGGGRLGRLGGGPTVGTITIPQYRLTRSGEETFLPVTNVPGTDSVDLVVQGSFSPALGITFQTTLRRIEEEEPLVFLARNQRFRPTPDGLAEPVLRTDADLLTPGQYELEFLPVKSDGTPLPRMTIRGRFEIPPP